MTQKAIDIGYPSYCYFMFRYQPKMSISDEFVLCPSAPSAVPAPVPVPALETPASVDKPAKTKAELKADRRARQEAERASKQSKKGEVGQQAATSKPKAQPSELQPGTALFSTT